MKPYAELHCHSAFSLLDGASTPEALVERAARLGIRALALTDHDDLGGAVRFSRAAREAAIEALIGAELTVRSAADDPAFREPSHLTLIARTAEGYGNLSELVTVARMKSPRGRPSVGWEDVAERADGLLCLTGCPQGELARRVRAGDGKGARALLDFLRTAFRGHVAVEVWDHALPEERALAERLLELADRRRCPAVATNDVHYAAPSGRIVHDVLTCLRHEVTLDEAGTRLRPNGEWHLKPPSAIWRRWRHRPDVVENAWVLAGACEFRLADLSPEIPEFETPPGVTTQEYLEALVWRGAAERYGGGSGRLRNGDPIRVEAGSGGPPGSGRADPRGLGRGAAEGSSRCTARGAGTSRTAGFDRPTREFHSKTPPPPGHPTDGSGSMSARPIEDAARSSTRGPSPPATPGKSRPPVRSAPPAGPSPPDPTSDPGGVGSADGGAPRASSSVTRARGEDARPSSRALRARWSETIPAAPHTGPGGLTRRVRSQIRHELAVIGRMNLAGYFLTVWDIVRFARRRGILVQGRGSAANSCVCYCLGITAVDPIGFDLLFERFLSEERGGAPDIDIDIAHEEREEVLQYVYGRYGRDRAAMVCEAITYRGRSAVRDAARVLGFSTDVADRLADEADRGEAADAAAALEAGGLAACGLDPRETRVRALVEVVRGLDRLPRHRSIHVGGFVLVAGSLGRVVPIEPASMKDRTVIQWDKDDLEMAGLIKIDLLGLGMLTCLQKAIRYIRETRGRALDLARLPAADPRVYEMIQAADTVGLFQIESRAQMNSLPRLRPENFYDLVVQVALIRPGPIQGEMVHPYVRRRRGEEPVTYLHPDLGPILERTLGVPLFQEQGMKVAVAMAGFTPGQADALRRAMGFKRSKEAMALIEPALRAGMTERGVSAEVQDRIVKQLTAFANYGFPESHAASFALLVYASAYLKTYYAPEFYCALLNSQPMGFYAPGTLVQDARRHGVEVRPVDLARSSWDCTLEPGSGSAGALRGSSCSTGRGAPTRSNARPRPAPELCSTTPAAPPRPEGDRACSPPNAPAGRDPVPGPAAENTGAGDGTASTPEPAAGDGGASGRALGIGAGPGRGPVPGGGVGAGGTPSSVTREWADRTRLSGSCPPHERCSEKGAARPHPPALRIGLRLVRGLGPKARERLEMAWRSGGPFRSVEDVVRRSGLGLPALKTLAEAGAFDTLWGPGRRSALWEILARLSSEPLAPVAPRTEPGLPEMRPIERVAADYTTTGLCTHGHPMEYLRPAMERRGVRSAEELKRARTGDRVKVAGVVICRQRPGTAKGVCFITLEDETGFSNFVVYPDAFQRHRRTIVRSSVLLIEGVVQHEQGVVNVQARAFEAVVATAGADAVESRDFH